MVGGDIVRLLSQQGVVARALVRNPQKARNLPGITWVTGDLAKPETLPAAFEGADTLFLVSSIGEDTVALQHNAIEAARHAGVTHIVKLSAFGATDHSKAPICLWHYQIEQEMQESGMEWTILRPHPPLALGGHSDKSNRKDQPCVANDLIFQIQKVKNWRHCSICLSAVQPPTRCSRTALPVARTIWRPKRIAEQLTMRGLGVLRFDFTGLGGSQGDFANTNFSSNVDDLIAAADHLRKTYAAPTILIGHSLGGTAMLAAAGKIPEARGVATIAAPYQPNHVTNLFKADIEKLREDGEIEVTLAGRPFQIKREFLEDVADKNLHDHIAKLRKALLVLHSPTDDIVGIENATQIFTTAKHPKSFVSLAGADHLLSRRSDAEYVANVIAAWAETLSRSGAKLLPIPSSKLASYWCAKRTGANFSRRY